MAKVKLNYEFDTVDLYKVLHGLTCKSSDLTDFEESLCLAISASIDWPTYMLWVSDNFPNETIDTY